MAETSNTNAIGKRALSLMVALSLGSCALAALLSGVAVVMLGGLLILLCGVAVADAAFRANHRKVRDHLSVREMEQRARQDALTGLLNRTGLASELSQRAARQDRFALLFLDLDGFKNVNDNKGDQISDELVKLVSERLRAACASEDSIARVGTDEFVILSTASDIAAARAVGERLIATIGDQDLVPGSTAAFAGVSIGIAICPDHGKDLGGLLGEADAALYQAKYSGRARCVVARAGQMRTPTQPMLVDRSIAPNWELDRNAA